MNTKQTGDTSEAIVIAELTKRGFRISVPFGDNSPYDLVADSGTDLFRVQVKTGWLANGCIRFKTYSKTTRDGEIHRRGYSTEDIEAFAVRCRDTGGLYWIPVELASSGSMNLRVEAADIDHPRINYAAEYTFDNNLPSS